MRLTDFDYQLPEDLIARFPTAERTASRLLCFDSASAQIQHRQFNDILDLLNPHDLLIFNNTKVIPARLFGQKTSGGKVEILVDRMVENNQALCLIRASKAPKINSQIIIANTIHLTVLERQEEFFLLQFPAEILSILENHGELPLPPYFDRKPEAEDFERYQTVYAEHAGAVAAPTAGLHFDKMVLKKIAAKGVNSAHVTLHVGAGTFQPVRVENITEHKMHWEYAVVPEEVCIAIKAAKQKGGRIIAVGTTSVRSLETAAMQGEIKPYQGLTNIFIYPGFEFQCVDAMITNFHLPKSTLLMLVSAFIGLDNVKKLYQEAIKEQYRFYSYGDAMFLVR